MVRLLELFKRIAAIAAVYFFVFYESEGYLDVWIGAGCITAIFVFIWIQLEYFGDDFEEMEKSMDAERIRNSAERKAKNKKKKANLDPEDFGGPISDISGFKKATGHLSDASSYVESNDNQATPLKFD